MIAYEDFAYNNYNWGYCYYKGVRKCTDIFTFDIETTSIFIKDNKVAPFDKNKSANWYDDAIKVGFCYIWMLGINDTVVYGRYLEDFLPWLSSLVDKTICADICCYIHNASFEFNFLRNFFTDVKVFARKKRRPIYFAVDGIEFRCSYMLTRLSLAKWASSKRLPVQKAVGDLDYTKIRTPLTPLNDTEFGYCESDILVMYYGISQYVKKYGTIWDIPLTQTGEVRRDFNSQLSDRDDLHKAMQKLVIEDLDLYRLLLQCYWGGIAHASQLYSGDVILDMDAYDFKSSYPWVMASEQYPSTPFVKCMYNPIYDSPRYSYIITVECNNIRSKMWNTYISISKCVKLIKPVDDNGRLLSADYMLITCTNIDWHNIQDSYKMDNYEILDFRVSINRPLDKDIIMYILNLFANKTLLDGVEGQEDNYAKSKEFINAIYGMMVTREITDEITYDDNEWGIDKLTLESFKNKTIKKKRQLRKLNNAIQIGVWVTAYARNNLWTIVKQLDDYTAYLDTDSDKLVQGYDKSVIDRYNARVLARQEELAEAMHVSIDMFRPVSPKGKQSILGIFAYEGHYKKFKTLGSKKYIYESDDGKLHMTVSGVRKEAVRQLNSIEDFKNGFMFDIDNSKKLLLHYNDNQPVGLIVNKGLPDEWIMPYKYGICAQPTTYTLGVTEFYYKTLVDIISEKSKILEPYELLERIIDNAKKRKEDDEKRKKRKI